MKIKRYKIEITLDIVHGWKSTIDEVYVPAADLFINDSTCFIGGEDNKDRVPPGAIEEELDKDTGICAVRLANNIRDNNIIIDDIRAKLFKDKI